MRTLAAIAGVLLALLLLCGWLLKGAWEDLSRARADLEAAHRVAEAFEGRFNSLDSAVASLRENQRKTDQWLAGQLNDLKTITKTEDDTDETIACLDMPVARQLDQWLRKPAGN